MPAKHYYPRENGFTLIEVLVAMLIIAIGILGITALQYKGLQYNQDAYYRTQVNLLAYDIADRMRLNQKFAADYANAVTNYAIPAAEPAGCVQTGAVATAVNNDILCWQQLLFQALPPGSIININNDGAGLYTISISWADRENNPHLIDYTFQP